MLGVMLAEMPKNEGTRGQLAGGNIVLPPANTQPTLSELGIEKIQSSRWQAVAAVPEEVFEQLRASNNVLPPKGRQVDGPEDATLTEARNKVGSEVFDRLLVPAVNQVRQLMDPGLVHIATARVGEHDRRRLVDQGHAEDFMKPEQGPEAGDEWPLHPQRRSHQRDEATDLGRKVCTEPDGQRTPIFRDIEPFDIESPLANPGGNPR